MGWQSQEDATCKKIYVGLGTLKRIRPLVLRKTLLRMYDALVLLTLIIVPRFGDAWGKACVTKSRDCKTGSGEL